MTTDKTEKRKRGRPAAEAGLTGRLALRTLPEDMEQLAALVAKFSGFDGPTVTRNALRLGMTVLELAPDLFVQAGVPASKRRAVLKSYLTAARE